MNNVLAFTATVFSMPPKHLKTVPISPMPGDFYRQAIGVVEPRQCYDNCRSLMMMNAIKDFKYVLAYTFSNLPFEHAILKLDDGTYVDPTLEIVAPHLPVRYVATHELSYDELEDIMMKIGRAPSIADMINLDRFGCLDNEARVERDIIANAILASDMMEEAR